MATLHMSAIPYTKSKDGCLQMLVSLMIASPSKSVEIKNTEDAKREVAAYAKEMEATGKPYRIGADIHKGRKPNGFDAARKELTVYVNEAAAMEGAAA